LVLGAAPSPQDLAQLDGQLAGLNLEEALSEVVYQVGGDGGGLCLVVSALLLFLMLSDCCCRLCNCLICLHVKYVHTPGLWAAPWIGA
jgi:hypothetical protein